MGTPAFETRSLHQLTMSRLGVHDLLECRAFLQCAVCPLVRLPVIPFFPRNTAVRRCRIKHGDAARAGACHLDWLILLRHPRPELVGVATPLVIHRLAVGPVPPDNLVIIGAHPCVHRR